MDPTPIRTSWTGTGIEIEKVEIEIDCLIGRGRTQIAAGSRTVLGIGPGECCDSVTLVVQRNLGVVVVRTCGTREQGDRQAATVVEDPVRFRGCDAGINMDLCFVVVCGGF